MKISLLAVGSRGDTQPCAALGARLQERGHEVVVVAAERYERLIVDSGLEFRPMKIDPAEVIRSEPVQEALAGGVTSFLRNIRPVVAPLARQVLQDVAEGSRDADVVLASPVGGLGRHVAERFGIPHVLLHFQPSEPTGEFASPLLHGRDLGRPVNWASYRAAEKATGLALRTVINEAREHVLGLPPLRHDTFRLDRDERIPVLCGVSPLVVTRPFDWPEHVHLTGPWLTEPTGVLDPELLEFLIDGPPPVWISFGSMEVDDPVATGALVVAAARAAGARAVVQGLPVSDLMRGDDVFVAGEVDHASAFRRMAAVVHHGGAGTTAAVMRAGVPGVVCPFFADQPYWAERVAALGAGPAPVPQKRLSASRLGRAIHQAVGDPGIRARATDLGRALNAEDGCSTAADLVEQHVAVATPPRLGVAGRRERRLGGLLSRASVG